MNKIVTALFLLLLLLSAIYVSQGKFSGKEIRLGMSGPFSGSKKNLGQEMLMGAQAYFKGINTQGGVFGRYIKIITRDDRYEPNLAIENAKKFINDDKIFAFFGLIGTPTAKVILPIALEHNIPVIGTFSGANFLRKPAHSQCPCWI
ncbi:ABC transporter substrate-binding protein [Sulfurospirillum sp. 1612]|uniref:ABC transporter substrate-binding protein n=1 Tax=Sulfurospirillum sp. 1612 TaxID=3094835 RepID=UPI002F95323C